MTWHAVVGLCSIISGLLAYVAGALPGHYAVWLAGAGFALTAVDRWATAQENKGPSTPPSSTTKVG